MEIGTMLQDKIRVLNSLRNEINKDISLANEILLGARQKIRSNIKSDQNPNGCLSKQESYYLNSLELHSIDDEFNREQSLLEEKLAEAQKLEERMRLMTLKWFQEMNLLVSM